VGYGCRVRDRIKEKEREYFVVSKTKNVYREWKSRTIKTFLTEIMKEGLDEETAKNTHFYIGGTAKVLLWY